MKPQDRIYSINPANGTHLEPGVSVTSESKLSSIIEAASNSFSDLRDIPSFKRADFLEEVGLQILELGDELILTVMKETGLLRARVEGERSRTVSQLNMFASVVREGSWTEASIDEAIPDRQPNPKPDIRKMLVPIGPVVVFTASNFPLAFSTAGGDTASAIAAGNPVIVKAHEAHVLTNDLITRAIKKALAKCEMPEGTFNSVYGIGFDLGTTLVKHPEIKAVGFTGSYSGGKKLYDIANARPEPIPVFAEMSSVNPVVILPETLKSEKEEIVEKLVGSITLGTGQFCTNPGLIIMVDSDDSKEFANQLKKRLSFYKADSMLTKNIEENYANGINKMSSFDCVEILGKGDEKVNGSVAIVKGSEFIKYPTLQEEIFGPFSLVVNCQDNNELLKVINSLSGQLTGTVIGRKSELLNHENVVWHLQDKVGRLIINDVPTGVEVCDSMIHGGPFPSSTDGRFTSVGAAAIKRFARPICYQGFPQDMLPLELQDSNPLKVLRRVNGKWENTSSYTEHIL